MILRTYCAILITICVAGCGKSSDGREAVSGSVTFNGAPLAQGTIEFTSVDGSQQSGGEISQGEYFVPAEQGLLPGKYVVRIYSTEEAASSAPPGPPGPEAATVRNRQLIPPQYNTQSTLTAEVTADGDNRFDFQIP